MNNLYVLSEPISGAGKLSISSNKERERERETNDTHVAFIPRRKLCVQ